MYSCSNDGDGHVDTLSLSGQIESARHHFQARFQPVGVLFSKSHAIRMPAIQVVYWKPLDSRTR